MMGANILTGKAVLLKSKGGIRWIRIRVVVVCDTVCELEGAWIIVYCLINL